MKNLNTKLISIIALILSLSVMITPASANEVEDALKKSMVQEILLDLKLNTKRFFNTDLKEQFYFDPIQVKYLKQPIRIPLETFEQNLS